MRSPQVRGPLSSVLCLLENKLVGTAGKERVGPTEREALNIYITIRKIRQPEGICSMAQGARIPCSDSLGVGWGGDMCVPTAESC